MSCDPIALVEKAHRCGQERAAWGCAMAPDLLPELDAHWLAGAVLIVEGSVAKLAASMPPPRPVDRRVERWLQARAPALVERAEPCGITSFAETLSSMDCPPPVRDVVALSIVAGPRSSLLFMVATERRVRLDAPTRRFWHRLAVHLGATFSWATVGEPLPRSRARSLRRAVHELERRAAPRDDAREALDLWYGLLAGRWSLVDRFDANGRRYLVAQRRERGSEERLTRRQRQVVFHASLGCANGEIAHALGVADNTVSAHLHLALQKLQIRSRAELVKLATRVTAAVTPAPTIASRS